MNPPFTPITLCADDYAQNEGIDYAILALLAAKRLTAVSCFSTSPRWLQQAAPALREYSAQADMGLHFNLTEGFTGPALHHLNHLILRSLVTRLEPQRLARLLHHQLDAFEAGFARAPAFIDGHQHVHQLPGVRQVLLQILQSRYPGMDIWVRNTVPANPQWRGKAAILKHLGGAAIAGALQAASIRSNNGFAGVYGFDRTDYDICFAEWIRAAKPGMLIMCHPGASVNPNDAIAEQRLVEYHFLRSPAFDEMLDAACVRLLPLSKIAVQH